MSREKRGQRLGHLVRALDVKKVRGAGEVERLDPRQPGKQEVPPLTECRSAVLAEDGKDGLCDPARIGLGERPLLHSRQLLGEECVRTVEDLLEKAGQTPIKRGAVAHSEDPRAQMSTAPATSAARYRPIAAAATSRTKAA